jgi:hypothetical protein
MLLAKLWDKIQAGMRRGIMANTCFLSPREQEMARYLFGDAEGLFSSAATMMRSAKCWCICRNIWKRMP